MLSVSCALDLSVKAIPEKIVKIIPITAIFNFIASLLFGVAITDALFMRAMINHLVTILNLQLSNMVSFFI
jgi:hypothetical protein